MAAWRGYLQQAGEIFSAVQAACPDNEGAWIGKGIALMNAGRKKDAIRLLEQALEMNPDNVMGKCFLGMAWKMAGSEGKATQLLDEVMQAGSDESAAKLARILLGLEEDEDASRESMKMI